MARPVEAGRRGAANRPYRSVLRSEQAQLTRSRILDSAESLFLTHGYGATTIAAIAKQAEVAVDTVYATFGSKKGVLKSLMDVRVVGDDQPVALLQRDEPAAAAAEPDPHRRLEAVTAGIAAIHERARRIDDLMLSAAGSDAEIAALRVDIQQRQRLEGMRHAVAAIKGTGGLRPDLDDLQAADILWAIAGPDVHRLLRDQRGWTADEYRVWLADTINALLLP
jgi:TetR/AcrR family transcriptional regulator, regulator of autoinduction and epiphytic fitness